MKPLSSESMKGIAPNMKCITPFIQRFTKPPSLKATLVGAMLFTVGTTAAIVYFPWSLVSKRNIDTMVEQVNQEVVIGTTQEVEKLFNSAQSAQTLLNSSLAQDLIDLSDPRDREWFLLNVLQANPDFTWVQYGAADGDFLGAQRTSDERLHFHLRDWDDNTQTTMTTVNTYEVEAETLNLVETESFQMEPAFYAPERPWYRNSLKSPNERAWTVYVYRSTQNPGMDATKAFQRGGETIGVIGVGIELKQLSEYLQELGGSHGGEAFIINSHQELIASTDVDEVMPDQELGESDPKLQEFDAVSNPILHLASEMLEAESVELQQLDSLQRYVFKDPETGERYFISLKPLDRLDWIVGTVIPEANFLVEVNRNKRILLVMIIVLTALTAGVAVFIADYLIARPVLGIANTAADIEAEKFELDRLGQIALRSDEIGRLARVFKHMAHEVYVREQRLKQQVRELRIEIDEAKRNKQVKEIVETDFFQDLTQKAQALRRRNGKE
jgi:HAMP domain-containing protein